MGSPPRSGRGGAGFPERAGSLPDWSKTMIASRRDGGDGAKLVLAFRCGKVKK